MGFGLTCNPWGFNTSYMIPWGPDMFGGIPGSLNIQWNQGIADLQARANMWQVPTFQGSLFSYPNMAGAGMSFLCDPAYTINQMMWNSVTGNGNWGLGMGNSGIFNNGFVNPWNNAFNPFNPAGGSSSSSDSGSSSSANKSVEKTFEKRYNKLLGFMKKLNEYAKREDSHILNAVEKERLEELVKGSSEKTKEGKYNELKRFYDSLNKDDIKDFLVFGSDKLTINNEEGGTSLAEKLERIGYENPNGVIEQVGNSDGNGNVISTLHNRLKNISKKDAKLDDAIPTLSAYSALDIISSYNSKYPNEDLIDLLFEAYNKVDKNQRDTVKGNAEGQSGFRPLVFALTKEARNVAKEIKGESKDKIEETAEKLEKAYDKFNKSEVKDLFNKLYVMTRIASAKVLENTLASTYGTIDNELFRNNSFILKETEKDLREEGLGNIYNNVKNDINLRSCDIVTNVYSDANVDDLETEQKITSLRQNEIITIKPDTVTVNGEEETVYEETVATGNRSEKRQFILSDDGDFIEIKEEDGEWKPTGHAVKASTIQSNVNDAKRAANQSVSSSGSSSSSSSSGSSSSSSSSSSAPSTSYYTGAELYNKLSGTTDNRYYNRINDTLASLDKENVVAFLKDYYDESGYDGSLSDEGIIEQLDDECDGGRLKMENKRNLINSLMSKASDLGLSNDSDYKELEDYLSEYDDAHPDADTFRKDTWGRNFWGRLGVATGAAATGAAVGAGIGALAGLKSGGKFAKKGAIIGCIVGAVADFIGQSFHIGVHKHNTGENIDSLMKSLFDKIVAKEKQNS